MKNKTYQKAVEHLEFSNDLYEKVMESAPQPKRHVRLLPALVAVVLITTLLVSTVLADGEFLQDPPPKVEHTVPVETLGTLQDELEDAVMMEFTLSTMTEGVTTHYMELDPVIVYSFNNGLLYGWRTGHLRITEDYQFEQLEMKTWDINFEKNGNLFRKRFIFSDTEEGVFSNSGYYGQKNEFGEILLNPMTINNATWPVYLNLETGAIRDALPEWFSTQFEASDFYGYSFRGGILVDYHVKTKNESYFQYYWIGPDATEAKLLNVPKDSHGIDIRVYNDTIYYKNEDGYLYEMDEQFNFRLISQYKTKDILTNGLLTVVTDDGKLAVFDAITHETYIFPEIDVKLSDIDEVTGYNAIRCGNDGTIALIHTEVNWDELQRELVKVCILDKEECKLRVLTFDDANYEGYTVESYHWLDENRFGMIFKSEDRQVICVYEFD